MCQSISRLHSNTVRSLNANSYDSLSYANTLCAQLLWWGYTFNSIGVALPMEESKMILRKISDVGRTAWFISGSATIPGATLFLDVFCPQLVVFIAKLTAWIAYNTRTHAGWMVELSVLFISRFYPRLVMKFWRANVLFYNGILFHQKTLSCQLVLKVFETTAHQSGTLAPWLTFPNWDKWPHARKVWIRPHFAPEGTCRPNRLLVP